MVTVSSRLRHSPSAKSYSCSCYSEEASCRLMSGQFGDGYRGWLTKVIRASLYTSRSWIRGRCQSSRPHSSSCSFISTQASCWFLLELKGPTCLPAESTTWSNDDPDAGWTIDSSSLPPCSCPVYQSEGSRCNCSSVRQVTHVDAT